MAIGSTVAIASQYPESQPNDYGFDCRFAALLRKIALSSLARMYRSEPGLFVFRLRRNAHGVKAEGLSARYTAIAVIGLATEGAASVAAVLANETIDSVCGRLLARLPQLSNLGDVALALWAGMDVRHPDAHRAGERLVELAPDDGPHPTVELSWALTALCRRGGEMYEELRERIARRLLEAFNSTAGTFPHVVGGRRRFADHVSCFADLIYPIQALAQHAGLTGSRASLATASRCARLLSETQGEAGQWWWHYDHRTGAVIEQYPVYAVHQDAMAPMALAALQKAGGGDFSEPIRRGLRWLAHSPELGQRSLIDDDAGLIWRKVARREPLKLSRVLQSAATQVHPSFRVPGLARALPPRRVDYEDRPYHLGWLLHALHLTSAMR
jgi:hypothetical protein